MKLNKSEIFKNAWRLAKIIGLATQKPKELYFAGALKAAYVVAKGNNKFLDLYSVCYENSCKSISWIDANLSCDSLSKDSRAFYEAERVSYVVSRMMYGFLLRGLK